MKKYLSVVVVAFALLGTWTASIADQAIESKAMTVVQTSDLEWKDYPGLPGVKVAVVFGDPKKEGVYVVRAKFAPHTMSRPHWHPEGRYVTVISGTWWAGEGDSYDPELTVPVPAGSFAYHTPREVHYDGAKDEEVVVQIIGVGPSGTTVVPIGGSKQ